MNQPINAIIFDMDGVLVDSEHVILEAAKQGLAEYGVTARDEDFTPFIGTGEDNYIGGVARAHGRAYLPAMKQRVYEIYLEIVADTLRTFPGVNQTLGRLSEEGFKLALASSADHVKIRANLAAAGIETTVFRAIVGGEDVERKKPAPDIFLLAARRLDEPPKRCLVVEDAVNGVAAARAAGMSCLGITGSFGAKDLTRAGASAVIDSLGQIPTILARRID